MNFALLQSFVRLGIFSCHSCTCSAFKFVESKNMGGNWSAMVGSRGMQTRFSSQVSRAALTTLTTEFGNAEAHKGTWVV